MTSGIVARTVAAYRRGFRERVKIARASGTGAAANIAWDEARYVKAHLRQYAPHEIAGSIMQGDQELMILTADLDATSFDVPPRLGDRVLMPNGSHAMVQYCDANTRRLGGVTVAYVCRVRG
jgi:hypothetical protein